MEEERKSLGSQIINMVNKLGLFYHQEHGETKQALMDRYSKELEICINSHSHVREPFFIVIYSKPEIYYDHSDKMIFLARLTPPEIVTGKQ